MGEMSRGKSIDINLIMGHEESSNKDNSKVIKSKDLDILSMKIKNLLCEIYAKNFYQNECLVQ